MGIMYGVIRFWGGWKRLMCCVGTGEKRVKIGVTLDGLEMWCFIEECRTSLSFEMCN